MSPPSTVWLQPQCIANVALLN